MMGISLDTLSRSALSGSRGKSQELWLNPVPRRGMPVDAVQKLRKAAGSGQVHEAFLEGVLQKMHVGVREAGHDQAAAEVDDRIPWGSHGQQVFGPANCSYDAAVHGHCLS